MAITLPLERSFPLRSAANKAMTPARSMDVFSLRHSVVREHEQLATSFTTIHAADIREQVDAIYAEKRYWPEPLIQINPKYKSTSVADLVAAGPRVAHPPHRPATEPL